MIRHGPVAQSASGRSASAFPDPPQRPRQVDVVGVQPADDVVAGHADALVDGVGQAAVGLRDVAHVGCRREDVERPVRRAAVHHDMLDLAAVALVAHALERGRQRRGAVQAGCDDRDAWEAHRRGILGLCAPTARSALPNASAAASWLKSATAARPRGAQTLAQLQVPEQAADRARERGRVAVGERPARSRRRAPGRPPPRRRPSWRSRDGPGAWPRCRPVPTAPGTTASQARARRRRLRPRRRRAARTARRDRRRPRSARRAGRAAGPRRPGTGPPSRGGRPPTRRAASRRPSQGRGDPTYSTSGASWGMPAESRHAARSAWSTSRPKRSASTACGATNTLRSLPRRCAT